MSFTEALTGPVPVTILTGFLGSGKTTLLNRILSEKHGQKIAVIENEFGEAGIDSELLINSEEQIVEVNNGCICCTVRGDLVRMLGRLAERREQGHVKFDRVIIETTGLAAPAPVAQTFFIEKKIAEYYLLDAIITIVDAKHALQQLNEYHEAQEQVGFADRLLLSKNDLVSEVEVEGLINRLKAINPRAQIDKVHFGKTELSKILDIRGFNLDALLEVEPEFLKGDSHKHHTDISSFVFRSNQPFIHKKLEAFLNDMIQGFWMDLLRYKGVLYLKNENARFVFQGVHTMMDAIPGKPWGVDENKENVIVFIGRNLPKEFFLKSLESCLATS
ncbi:MAG: GTP-binding protein [Pseudomonadota bacterium]